MKGQMKAIGRGLFTAVIILATVVLPARGQYAGGSGTADDPYLIETAEQLNAIGLREADWNKHFRLTADIDMNDLGATPVNLIFFFQGVFDGNDHTIANLIYRVKDEDGQPGSPYVTVIGLFRVLSGWDALVQNLGLIDPNVRPDPTCTKPVDHVGALVGRLEQGWIRNCYVKGGYVAGSSTVGGLVADCSSDAAVSECWSSADVSGSRTVGGLIGYVARASVWSCHVAASVSGAMNVGGLVGVVQEEDSTIEDCFTTGTVTGSQAGGLVGYLNEGSIWRCYSTASLSGGSNLGGLVGENHGLIHTSWAGGAIAGGTQVGGLVGYNRVGDGIWEPYFDTQVTDSYATGAVRGDNVIGGLIGYNEGTLLRCYSTGAVTASGAVPASSVKYSGGLVGLDKSVSKWDIQGCFWDATASGVNTSAGGTGKTTAEMQNMATYLGAGWDFIGETANGAADLWKMSAEGPSYPKLAWE